MEKSVQIAQKQNPLKFFSFSSFLNENILKSETYMVWLANVESKGFYVSDFFLISACQINSLNLIQICKAFAISERGF